MLQFNRGQGRERYIAILEDIVDTRVGRKQQLLYIVAPVFLLLICLGTINLAPALVRVTGTNPSIQAAEVASATSIGADASPVAALYPPERKPVATRSLWPSPTPYIVPTVPPGAEIYLFGPPSNGAFTVGDTISFYWQWRLPLAEDQSLTVYLLTEDQELFLGRLAEPNVGTSYRLQVSTRDLAKTADTIRWQVRLESQYVEESLLASEIRPLRLLASPGSIR